MAFNLKTWLLGLVANHGIDLVSDNVELLLEKFYQKKPLQAAALASSLYIWIDTVVEDYAETTNTEIDDKAVDEFKEDIEKFAALHNITLTNLDTGTVND